MKKCLIVVDYQNDFVDGSLGFDDAGAVEQALCRKIEQYLEQGGDVVFTFDTHDRAYLQTREGRDLPVAHCIKDTDGWKLYGKAGAYLGRAAEAFEKKTFGSLELAEYLKQAGYEQVEFVGVVTNVCVLSNAVLAKAALPEAELIVDAACTAGPDKDLCEKTFDVLEGLYIHVLNRKNN